MSIGSILLGLALFIILLLFLAKPFLRYRQPTRTVRRYKEQPLTRRQQLTIEKEQLLTEINQLDFDHDTGKIPKSVYKKQRDHLVQVTADLLQQLDELENDNIDNAIENAVRRLRTTPLSIPSNGDTPPQGKMNFCTQCGTAVLPTDKFCAHCGQQLTIPT